MQRTEFLSRLRTTTPHNVAHPLVHVAEVPAVAYDQDLDDPVSAFMRNAAMQGTQVSRVGNPREFVGDVIAQLSAAGVISSGDPEVAQLGFEVFDRPRPDADLGVVGALYGIAATGTVVFHAGR